MLTSNLIIDLFTSKDIRDVVLLKVPSKVYGITPTKNKFCRVVL